MNDKLKTIAACILSLNCIIFVIGGFVLITMGLTTEHKSPEMIFGGIFVIILTIVGFIILKKILYQKVSLSQKIPNNVRKILLYIVCLYFIINGALIITGGLTTMPKTPYPIFSGIFYIILGIIIFKIGKKKIC